MNKIKRIVIVANGNIPNSTVSHIHKTDVVIGVDRAAYWLIERDVAPDVAIGDFDSVSGYEMSVIKKQSKSVSEFPSKKDVTDLELAIHQAILLPKEVLIVGAFGTRLDHSFVAVQLLEKFIGTGIFATIRDEKNECVLCSVKLTVLKNAQYKYLSILPVTDGITISINGCAYPLKHAVIRRGVSLGVSNEIVSDKAEIVVHKGIALIIRSND
jgi:thiamine pyrophosphokinase